jgi:hypothetical protein
MQSNEEGWMRLIEHRYRHQSAFNWLAVIGWLSLAKRLHCSDWIFYSVLVFLALAMNYRVVLGPSTKETKADSEAGPR